MELQVFQHDGVDVVDSRMVAEMTGKNHKDLMRSIHGYVETLSRHNERNIAPVDFFILSTYKDNKGETRPCYLLTKKGCDMVANKMTGEKGVLFTAAYVTAFEAMREHIEKGAPMTDYQRSVIEARQRNLALKEEANRIKKAQLLEKIAAEYEGTYHQVLQAHATKELTGEFLLPLPTLPDKTYSAEEVGARFGISANRVGRIANANGLKTEQFGEWFADKARSVNKEVSTFRYFASVFPEIEKALEQL